MADSPPRPLLKPILHLKKEPDPGRINPRGKSVGNVVEHRLANQQKVLSKAFREMDKTATDQPNFSGHVVIYADMFKDSSAPTHTPNDLFRSSYGAQLTTPHRTGYLVQMRTDYLGQLASKIEDMPLGKESVDISRVQSVTFFNEKNATGGRTLDVLWEKASEIEAGRAFIIWLMPLQDKNAQESLIQKISTLQNDAISSPPPLLQEVLKNLDDEVPTAVRHSLQTFASEDDRIVLAMRNYQRLGHTRATVIIPSKAALGQLLTSGTVLRINPVSPIISTTPGSGREPNLFLPPDMSRFPIVGVVDGGLTARSYEPAEAWRAPPFIPDGKANAKHGNQVTSLIVQGHEWNNGLKLPPLHCQVGTVQAVPKAPVPPDPESFISYLDFLMSTHTDTQVWNFSLNQAEDCSPDDVDSLSHDIAVLARKHKILPIISTGNRPGDLLRPPADCEAAITVGGRQQDSIGNPAGKCDISLNGPGPSNMLKPELSNFSEVRVIGGEIRKGSSFATALTSPVAAHTIAQLRDPSPDLVKALLLHNTDLNAFDPNRGFGTPVANPLPWLCRPGFVTLQWTEKIRPGNFFYWELPIPNSLRKTKKLKGAGILTAILNPHPMVSEIAGINYFSVRIQTALQYQRGRNSKGAPAFHNLLGSLSTERLTEQQARKLDHKWSPIRHHKKSFRGIGFEGNNLRISTRIFFRDSYLYEESSIELMKRVGLDTVFVLSIGTNDGSDDIYDEICNELGTSVESAIVDSAIDIGDSSL